jgi:hypothetical protein
MASNDAETACGSAGNRAAMCDSPAAFADDNSEGVSRLAGEKKLRMRLPGLIVPGVQSTSLG